MTAATLARSAYPPAIADLMPRAIQLTKTLDGELPSRNRLKKDLHIGPDKAKAVLAELVKLAEPDDNHADPSPALPAHRDPAERPPLAVVPPAPADPAPPLEPVTPAEPVPPIEPVAPEAEAPAAGAEPAPAAQADDRRPVTWPVLILCLPAFVAIWGGWVEMGRLTGFGMVKLLPGIADHFEINTAITLPIGVETYAAYALFVWLSGHATGEARKFAKYSAIASLTVGGLGQIAYHLMNAAGWTSAPWPITAAVACIPVAVLGMGAALAHLMNKH